MGDIVFRKRKKKERKQRVKRKKERKKEIFASIFFYHPAVIKTRLGIEMKDIVNYLSAD